MAAESKYQKKVKDRLEKDGWFVMRMINVTSTHFKSGMPDLLAIKPSKDGLHEVQFIEVKAKNGKTSKIQEYAHKCLSSNGFNVIVDKEC
jgi:Holliday junction resolvase